MAMINDRGDLILSVKRPGAAYANLIAERNRRRKVFWTMAGGKLIDVKEMDDNHLNNTIDMLRDIMEMQRAAEEAVGGDEG